MSVADKINQFKKELPENCTLVAVSKTKPSSDILEAYEGGHRDFGENKVQELTTKYEELPKDIRWHMIGHLQRNKVKYLVDFVHLIHGVDSVKLLKEINKRAKKVDRVIDCLLQVHIAREESKFGFDEDEVLELLLGQELPEFENVRITGLMGMATFTENTNQVSQEFRSLKEIYDRLAANSLPPNVKMETLSMGMSGDYRLALEEGSNMIRVGSLLFGEREYH